MSSQNKLYTFEQSIPNSTSRSYREQRNAKRAARHEVRERNHAERPFRWIGGTILILLGVVFLMQDMGILIPVNWWSIMFLIPASVAYESAWNIYRKYGQAMRNAIGPLCIGFLFTILSLIFLFNIAIEMFWPILFITSGVMLIMKSLIWTK